MVLVCRPKTPFLWHHLSFKANIEYVFQPLWRHISLRICSHAEPKLHDSFRPS